MFQSRLNSTVKSSTLLGGLVGSVLVGLPVVSFSTIAQAQVNPCPGIYYETPYNTSRIVPQGCPPNAATNILIQQGRLSGSQYQYNTPGMQQTPAQPGSANKPQNTIATITPIAGKVNVRLKNDTNAQIFYEAVGYTDRRTLMGGGEVVLQGLPTPVTVTLTRQDEGLLKVLPLSDAQQQGLLSVSLEEAADLSDNQGNLRIQQDGQVLLF